MLKQYGRAAVSEFLGDFIVYRNLIPVDRRLPSLKDFASELNLPADTAPRKSSPEYAQVIIRILAQARAIGAPQAEIKRVIFLGDTRMNDGTAFVNICRAGGWPGYAFIGAEKTDQPEQIEIIDQGDGCRLYAANRWSALVKFERYLNEQNFLVDENTVVLIDMDKTMLGARGRNDRVIDQARVQAAFQTVSAALGDDFDAASFEAAYQQFNQPEFHTFTLDNQDYLVYLSLILAGGVYAADKLADAVTSGGLVAFGDFLNLVEGRADQLGASLLAIHRDVAARFQAGDPTPFKAFRRKEYQITAARLGCLGPESALETVLAEEIVITQEVRAAALAWRQGGALIFGLSDKPDEASIPTAALARAGHLPLHQITTDIVGEDE